MELPLHENFTTKLREPSIYVHLYSRCNSVQVRSQSSIEKGELRSTFTLHG